MKKNKFLTNFSKSIFLAGFVFLTFTTCKDNVGLGSTVDINPPTGSVNALAAGNATPIRGSFSMSGKASDDSGVESVKVSFKNRKTGVVVKEYTATLASPGADSTNWSLDVNNEQEKNADGTLKTVSGHPLVKVYPIPDGEYNVAIKTTDSGGKTYTTTVVYTIDNTPPVLFISRPGTVLESNLSSGAADLYGSIFKVAGESSDSMSPVKKLSVIAYDSANLASGSKEISVKLGGNSTINYRVAMAENPVTTGNYGDLLGLQGGQVYQRNIVADFVIEDKARNMKDLTDEAGNKSEFFYFIDDFRSEFISKEFSVTTISDYLSNKKAVSGATDANNVALAKIWGSEGNATRALLQSKMIKVGDGSTGTGVTDRKMTFKLDPNKDPGYYLNAVDLKGNGDALNEVFIGGKFVIGLIKNVDKIPLISSVDLAGIKNTKIRVFLIKNTDSSNTDVSKIIEKFNNFDVSEFSGTGTSWADAAREVTVDEIYDVVNKIDGGATNIADLGIASASDGALNLTLDMPASSTPGPRLLVLTGKDTEGNEFTYRVVGGARPAHDKYILFKFIQSGAPPTLFVDRLQNPYFKSSENVDLTMTIQRATTQMYYTVDGGSTKHNITTVNATTGSYSISHSLSGFSEGEHKIKVHAVNNVGTVSKEISLWVDDTSPSLALDSGKPASGTITSWTQNFTGTADDTLSKVEKITYYIGKGTATAQPTSWGTENDLRYDNTAKTWQTSVSFSEAESQYVKVVVYDNAGNTKEKVYGPYDINMNIPKFDDILATLNSTTVKESIKNSVTEYVNKLIIGSLQFQCNASSPVPGVSVSKIQVKVNGSTFTADSSGLVSITGLTEANFTAAGIQGLKFEFWVFDNSTPPKQGYVEKYLKIDTTPPVVKVTDPPISTTVSFSSNPSFSGYVTDAESGVDSNTLNYKIIKKSDNSVVGVPGKLTLDTNGVDWTIPAVTIPNEGNYELEIYGVKDKAGNAVSSSVKLNFAVDRSPPTLSVTKYEDDGAGGYVSGSADSSIESYEKADFWFDITASDTNEMHDTKPVVIDGLPSSPIYPTKSGTGWKYKVPAGSMTENTYDCKITVKDIAGKKVEKTFRVVVDRTAPVISNTIIRQNGVQVNSGDWIGLGAISISGQASDAQSSVRGVCASFDGTNWTPLSRTTNFSGEISVLSGATKLKIRAVDAAGNEFIHEIPVKIDETKPTLEITEFNSSTNILPVFQVKQEAITIKGTCNDYQSGAKEVKWELGSINGTLTPTATATTGEYTWQVTIPAGSVTDGTLKFTAVDNVAGESAVKSVVINVDTTNPTVSFTRPSNTATVNKKIKVQGSSGDDKGVKSVVVKKSDGTDLVGVTGSSGANASKAEFTNNNAYNWSFDLNTQLYPDDADIELKAIVTDLAGNVTESTLTIRVDQDTDRPQIVITNPSKIDGTGVLTNTREMRGTIQDDDGLISEIRISETGSAPWTTVNINSGSWKYDIQGADGKTKIYFKLTDDAGYEFMTTNTNELEKPRIYDSNTYSTGSYTSTVVQFKMDNKIPTTVSSKIAGSDGVKKDLSSVTFLQTKSGGLYNNPTFTIIAKDSNNIESVEVKFVQGATEIKATNTSRTSPTSLTSNVEETWTATGFSGLAGLNDGGCELLITVKDTCGLTSNASISMNIDNSNPDVIVTSPAPDVNQTGDIKMQGRVEDFGSGAKTLKYIAGKKSPVPTAATTGWTDVSLSGVSWIIEFSDANNNSITKPNEPGNPVNVATLGNSIGSDLYEIPIYFLVTDDAGNSVVKEKKVRVDPYGDIPEVTVLGPGNKTSSTTVGGGIKIYGTVSVKDPSVGSVNEMYIQITKNTNASGKPDFTQSCTFNSTEWCTANGGAGVKLPDFVSGGAFWSISINGSGEFEHATLNQQHIWYRLRGKNGSGKFGQWTDPHELIVDKTAPQITASKVTNTTDESVAPLDPPAPNNAWYVPNMWIKGDDLYIFAELKHGAGIKEISISGTLSCLAGSTVTLTGESEITGTNIAGTGKQWFTPSTVTSSTASKNYIMRLPLKTTDKPGSGNSFNVTILITSDKQTHSAANLTASKTWEFKYDNTAPSVAFGTKLYSSGTFKISANSFTDTGLKNRGIEVGDFVFTSGESIKITAFNNATGAVTLASVPIDAKSGYAVYHSPEYIWNISGSTCRVEGLADDIGAGVSKVKVKMQVNGVTTAEKILTRPSNIVSDLGTIVTWNAEIDTSTLTDGKGKLIFTAVDEAGNEKAPYLEKVIKLKNNPLKISKVTLGTDLDRNGNITTTTDATEKVVQSITYPAGTTNGVDVDTKDWSGNIDSDFVFKNPKSQIIVEKDGGVGTVKYKLEYFDGSAYQDLRALTTLASTGIIELTATDFNTIGQGTDKKLKVTLWDSATGLTAGTDTWKAELKLTVDVDTTDKIVPKAVIKPLFWNSKTDNSLYENNTNNGHIELSADLPSANFAGTAVYDKDDKVSGKITLTGTASDDQVVKEIYAAITSYTFTNAGPAGTPTGTVRIAYYDEATATWSYDANNFAANGWKFEVVESKFSISKGHSVKWKLHWDSSKLSGVVGANKTIKIFAKDTVNYNAEAVSGTAGSADYNKPTYRVDVVPYVLKISRINKYNTRRSSSGAWNVTRGDELTVKGFNIAGSSVKIKPQSVSATTVTANKFTLANSATSGKTELTVNGVSALNNKNNNGVQYNSQKEAGKDETLYWVDDLVLHVWRDDGKFPGSNNPKFPAMAMATNGDLYASFSNYSTAKVYYSKLGGSASAVFRIYDPPEDTDICVTGTSTVNVLYSANYYGGVGWGSNVGAAGGLYCYDAQASQLRGSYRFHRFELYYHNQQLQQFKNIRVARGSNRRIQVCYFDTLSKSVKYSSVAYNATGSSTHERPWINLDGGSDSHDTGSYTGGSSGILGNTQFEGGLTRLGATAGHCAIAIDGNNKPVVVYGDVDTGTLRLARATDAVPMSFDKWKVQKILATDDMNYGLVVDYFTAKFDSSGYLHIAFRNTRGQLCYIKSTNANAGATAYEFGKSQIVDNAGNYADITLKGTTAYISYMERMNVYDGIKVAYYDANFVKTYNSDGTPKDKGAWQIMTASMTHRAGSERTCVEVAPTNSLGWNIAVGYSTGDNYRVIRFVK